MQISNIEFMAKAVVELGRVDCDFIEYKKSAEQRDSILKTTCAFANNYPKGHGFLGETTKEDDTSTKELPITTQEKILVLLKKDPTMTAIELAAALGMTPDGIKYHIKNMREKALIRHEGSTKAGRWVVLGEEHPYHA